MKPIKVGCRLLRNKKTNFSLITNSHSSTNPRNLVKIGLTEFEIIGLTEIVKNKIFKNK